MWTYAADLPLDDLDSPSRKKRQIRPGGWGQRSVDVTIRGIDIDTAWFNFDAISRQTCIAKVRMFRRIFLEEDQVHDGQVTMINIDSNGYKSMSRNRVSTDTGRNGYCMVIPCKSHRQDTPLTYRGIIVADYESRGSTIEMKPATFGMPGNMRNMFDYSIDDGKIYMNYDQSVVHSAGTGPFYD